QNRFAKYRGNPELIYPLIPASCLTILKNNNYDVFFIDAIYEKLNIEKFLDRIYKISPDIIIFESKTPSIKKDWEVVNIIKSEISGTKIFACGDHVSVLPEETLENSKVDFVILGGDYDYVTFLLCEFLKGKEKFPSGICYKNLEGKIIIDKKITFVQNLDDLPFIDREIIPWQNYHEAWRLYEEFTYMYGSRGCPYRCTFCSWPQMLYDGKVRFRSPEKIVEEIELLIRKYGIKELFFDDDTFTCNKKWVLKICELIIEKDLKILWSCNGRVDNVDDEMLKIMKKSGCRMIKFGVESASQKTLDLLRKDYTIEDVKKAFELTKKNKILIHATAMIGFPWETKKDMLDTIKFIRKLQPDTCQFSLPIPYPGTKIFELAEQEGWLIYGRNWEFYDMSQPLLKNYYLNSEKIKKIWKKAWISVYFSVPFVLRKLKNLKNFKVLKLYFRGLISVLIGHLKLFSKNEC
ncbi:MAG: radical SAM protein, partial [Candidatus Omnitrophica bacterium]|nr:radical SAM protein [Candidatus Omnitrophota bacterium]